MNKIKTELLKVKPWLIIITFATCMFLIASNFNIIISEVNVMMIHLNPLFYGLLIAFVLNIPMTKLEAFISNHTNEKSIIRKHKRGISITISLILAISLISILLMIVIPEISESLIRLITNMSNYFNSMIQNLDQILTYLHIDIKTLSNLDLETFLKQFGLDYSKILQTASNLILGTSTDAIGRIGSIGSFLFDLFMGLMISLYLLGSKEMFIRQLKKLTFAILPIDVANQVLRIADISNDIFKEFVGGKLVEVAVVGFMVYGFMMLFNVPFAILIACLCAVMTIVPVFGPLVATIIACVLLLSVNPIQSVVFFIIYQVVQNLDGNLIYPKIIGKSLGLPAVWILVSILFFGGIFGAIGMLIAVPLTACIYTFGSEYIRSRLYKKNIKVDDINSMGA